MDKRKYGGRYNGFGRQFGVIQQLPSTNGSLALKDPPKRPPVPLRPARQESYEAEAPTSPIRKGAKFNVYFELMRDGTKRVIEGVLEVLDAMWIIKHWVFKVVINGIEQFFFWHLEWVLEGRAAWWSRPRQSAIEAGTDAKPAPAPILSLPAPRADIVGYLPAKCA